jgi:hypothetical protein
MGAPFTKKGGAILPQRTQRGEAATKRLQRQNKTGNFNHEIQEYTKREKGAFVSCILWFKKWR